VAVRTGAGRRSGLDPKEQQAPKDGRGCGRAFCDCGCGCDWWVCGGVARSIKASPLPVGWVLAAVGARAPPHLSAALSPSTRINVPRKGGRVERPPRRTWALQQNRQG
jgi:hypothetical protein